MKFIEIEWCSTEYQAALDLRHRVLREPLGLKLTAQELDGEYGQWHFAIASGDELPEIAPPEIVAVLVARPENSQTVQLRQMAVDPSRQGQGIGKKLLQECEATLVARGFREFQLDARSNVVAFYQKFGYQPVGEPFEHVTIEHQKMTKTVV